VVKRIVVGVTGASGAIYGIRLLHALRERAETHLVVSEHGKAVVAEEIDSGPEQLERLASRVYASEDLFAPIASGSFRSDAMVVIPCSVKTLSSIACSHADCLLARAADVTLKEGRRLILVVRESPLHAGHLDLMRRAVRLGAIICPPVPSFYHRPQSISDIVDFTVGRILDLLSIEHSLCRRWGEQERAAS
jgi:flavin prenyltransferase